MTSALSTLPVTVIGGYLGAGKTTLVNHLLRHAGGRRIAVAVNEFGALPIDQDLIAASDGNVLTLAGGCICCTFGSDLVAGLMDLAERATSLDQILIESSGVALPGAIGQSISLVGGLGLDGIVVVADAETVRARASDPYLADTITRQLADADVVVLNKIDLAPAADSLRVWLQPLAPNASLITTTHGAVAADVLLGTGSAFDSSAPRIPHSAYGLHTEVFSVPHSVDADHIGAALAARELGLVRVKGFVHDGARGGVLMQIVGRRYALTSAVSTAHHLVCIAHGRPIDRGAIAAIIERARSTP